MTKEEKINKEKFAKRLRQLMDENGETISTIAEIVNMDKSTIYRYTIGETAPKTPTVESIARYFDINPAWLLGYDVKKKNDNNNKNKPNTIAAHLEEKNLSKEERKQIMDYIDYLLSKRD